MSIKYPKFLNLRPSQIYPNWDFRFENKPSGNPETNRFEEMVSGSNGNKNEDENGCNENWDQCCDLKNKNLGKFLAFYAQTTVSFC
jgi:hypothetical protein